MGREVRMVPNHWQHPRKGNGDYKPLIAGYVEKKDAWEKMYREEGLQATLDYMGDPPDVNDYMPTWPVEECTHFQMYETTSEGTPISPVMPTAEDLARWLADNNASAFADDTATYDEWLSMIGRGSVVSMIIKNGIISSGVAAEYEEGGENETS